MTCSQFDRYTLSLIGLDSEMGVHGLKYKCKFASNNDMHKMNSMSEMKNNIKCIDQLY